MDPITCKRIFQKKARAKKVPCILSTYRAFEHAEHFLVDVGTPVYSAMDGQVIRTNSESNLCFKSENFGSLDSLAQSIIKHSNYVFIKNDNGIYTEYVNFGQNQVKVSVGDTVKAGQLLGNTGLSGLLSDYSSTKKHIFHFHAYTINGGKKDMYPHSLSVKFC